ncbi:MAG: methyltransferase domain-containing protein [Acetobacteraceae bacterium]
MAQLPSLPDHAFDKLDPTPDAQFYDFPRFVTHIDDGAITAVTSIYRSFVPSGGAILDLMSSWVSHLPDDVTYAEVVGHGMNADELAANARLARWFVQDLNADPALPLSSGTFDAATLCVSVQYLQRPVDVFREVLRVLKPAAPFVVSFSNRCFPTKAVRIWQSLDGPQQQRLVAAYMDAAGFTGIDGYAHTPAGADPLWAVVGHAPQTVEP